jgi:hypothetical protein
VIGVVALFAAIVGGGIKFRDIEVGDVKSLWRQGLLGIFGIVVSLIGLVLVIEPDIFNSSEDDTPQTNMSSDANAAGSDQNAAGTEQGTPPAATDENAGDATGTDANGTDSTTDSNSGQGSTE